MRVLNVFVNDMGEYGNPVGIVVDEKHECTSLKRQQIALESGFSEVVFINNVKKRNISIYTPKREIPFAGHAVVGAAYYISQEYHQDVTEIFGIGGRIQTWKENKFTWVTCDLSITPPWKYEQVLAPQEVDAYTSSQMLHSPHVVVWAWIDEQHGLIRARTFANDFGIPEDEANGSGSMKLAVMLGREITVQHGKGSIIHARPSKISGNGEVGGFVVLKN